MAKENKQSTDLFLNISHVFAYMLASSICNVYRRIEQTAIPKASAVLPRCYP